MLLPGFVHADHHKLILQNHIKWQSATPNQSVNLRSKLVPLSFCGACFCMSINRQLKARWVRSNRAQRQSAQLQDVDQTRRSDMFWWSRILHICSAALCPLMCIGFARVISLLNQILLGCPPIMEASVYLALAIPLMVLHRTGIIGSSVRSNVELIRQISLLLGLQPWRAEIFNKSKDALANTTNAMVVFIAINLVINAIPQAYSWPVPSMLRFLDTNGDGSLEAYEIEKACYSISSRVLGAYVVYQVVDFLMKTKQSHDVAVPDEAQSPLASFLRGMQHIRANRQSRHQTLSPSMVTVGFFDKMLSIVIWGVAAICWQRLSGVSVQTFAAIGGIGGLAFSFAAKNITQNAISGMLIYFNQKLFEGDEIADAIGKILGVVKRVGLNTTVVHRLQGDKLLVPNSQLVDNSIINVERRDFWLVDESFPIVLNNFMDLKPVVAKMKETVISNFHRDCCPSMDSVREKPLVYFAGYGHQGAMIKVRTYLPGKLGRHEFYEAQSDLLLELNDIALEFDGAAIGLEAHFVGGGRTEFKGGH